MADRGKLKVLVAKVAAAYFSNSYVRPAEIPEVIGQITASLREVDEVDRRSADEDAPAPADAETVAAQAANNAQAGRTKPTAAEIRRSIRDDGLVSFEDGRSYKTLKRHLTTRGLTPAQYREKWSLPDDYPMVCAASSAMRSALAKKIGLGRKDAPRVRKAKPSARMAKAARP